MTLSFSTPSFANLTERLDIRNVLTDDSRPNVMLVLPSNTGKSMDFSVHASITREECKDLLDLRQAKEMTDSDLLKKDDEVEMLIELEGSCSVKNLSSSTFDPKACDPVRNQLQSKQQEREDVRQKLYAIESKLEQEAQKSAGYMIELFDIYDYAMEWAQVHMNSNKDLGLSADRFNIPLTKENIFFDNYKLQVNKWIFMDAQAGSISKVDGNFSEEIKPLDGIAIKTTFTKLAFCTSTPDNNWLAPKIAISISYPKEINDLLESSTREKSKIIWDHPLPGN